MRDAPKTGHEPDAFGPKSTIVVVFKKKSPSSPAVGLGLEDPLSNVLVLLALSA
jgi:hypothetical protein